MSMLLCNISTSKTNLFCREMMLSCINTNVLGLFDLMFSLFQYKSRFNSCVKVDEVPWFKKSDSSFSKSVSVKKLIVLEGWLSLLWFSIFENCEQLFHSFLKCPWGRWSKLLSSWFHHWYSERNLYILFAKNFVPYLLKCSLLSLRWFSG